MTVFDARIGTPNRALVLSWRMDTIRVVWGSGTGPTAMASYDAALADAGVHNYNLVSVSSMMPPDVEVDPVGTAGDLGEVGGRLTVVEARATATDPGTVSAGLAWMQSPSGGLFYEAAGPTSAASVRASRRGRTSASGRSRRRGCACSRARWNRARTRPRSCSRCSGTRTRCCSVRNSTDALLSRFECPQTVRRGGCIRPNLFQSSGA